jgi:hypothetical protein
MFQSGRLDSNQRPPEPHFPGQGRCQPPDFTNASLLGVRTHSTVAFVNQDKSLARLPRSAIIRVIYYLEMTCVFPEAYPSTWLECQHVILS